AMRNANPWEKSERVDAETRKIDGARTRFAGRAGDKNAPASGRIEMRFTSKPEGATVQIDGLSNPAWTTPFIASDLKAGTHNLAFTKQGYAEETRRIEV